MKQCSSCEKIKEDTAFLKRRDTKCGLVSNCDDCRQLSYQRRRERILAVKRAYYVKHKARLKVEHKQWYLKNKKQSAVRMLAWQRRNRARTHYYNVTRNAASRGAIPKWANKFFIQEIYHLSRLRTKYLGIRHNVDHIVPLISPIVCGLHVENNLRIIPAIENQSKGNWHWPDMP